METWVRNLVMLVVLTVWGAYMYSATFVSKEVPSPFVWTIPGGTYALLTGRVPSFWKLSFFPRSTGSETERQESES